MSMKHMLLHLLLFLCFCLFTFTSEAAEGKREAWEEWPRVEGAFAKRGEHNIGVFHDPRRISDILIYPGCWLIRRDEKKIVSVNCPFKLSQDRLYFDTKWGYRPTGVEWGDPKIDSISFFSLIFRRPNIGVTSISFWDGQEWVHIEKLAALK
jgi:hypothetical protein